MKERDVDAVGRRAVDGMHVLVHVSVTERIGERQRMTVRALLALRCADDDVAERDHRVTKREQTAGGHAVVVRDQDEWALGAHGRQG